MHLLTRKCFGIDRLTIRFESGPCYRFVHICVKYGSSRRLSLVAARFPSTALEAVTFATRMGPVTASIAALGTCASTRTKWWQVPLSACALWSSKVPCTMSCMRNVSRKVFCSYGYPSRACVYCVRLCVWTCATHQAINMSK